MLVSMGTVHRRVATTQMAKLHGDTASSTLDAILLLAAYSATTNLGNGRPDGGELLVGLQTMASSTVARL